MKEIYLAGGCFWGLQKYFDCVVGVAETQAGFVNGRTEAPTYIEVISGRTGYAEAVKVRYDEKVIPLKGILDLYMIALDPRKAAMGSDMARSQFRAGVYYIDPGDGEEARGHMENMRSRFAYRINAEVGPLDRYYPAEEYHQHYLEKNPSGYCHISKGVFIYAGEYKVSAAG